VILAISRLTHSMPPPLPPPSPRYLLPPLIASLPSAAVSPQPPTALLPLLSPILRQRVQLLSAATKDPWLPLLCYDSEKVSKLSQIAQSDKFEPHPVSGEVEVDWDSEVETRYRRVDEETLEAYVSLREFELSVKLLWCTGDQEGGGDGWRIGEVSVLDSSATSNSAQRGWESIGEAEGRFKETTLNHSDKVRDSDTLKPGHGTNGHTQPTVAPEEEDDDDAYWALYDNTPARTPAMKRSPAPESMQNSSSSRAHNSEDAYYAQYASVQPAMDNHDPDEASQNGPTESTLSRSSLTQEPHDSPSHYEHNHDHDHDHDPELSSSSHIWASSLLPVEPAACDSPFPPFPLPEPDAEVLQPRPTSSSSSSSSQTVEKLESTAAALGQSEIGVKQHISTSVKSLFRLARAAGMERTEFERLVKTELDVLGLMEEDD
jgi:hypothetical protein